MRARRGVRVQAGDLEPFSDLRAGRRSGGGDPVAAELEALQERPLPVRLQSVDHGGADPAGAERGAGQRSSGAAQRRGAFVPRPDQEQAGGQVLPAAGRLNHQQLSGPARHSRGQGAGSGVGAVAHRRLHGAQAGFGHRARSGAVAVLLMLRIR